MRKNKIKYCCKVLCVATERPMGGREADCVHIATVHTTVNGAMCREEVHYEQKKDGCVSLRTLGKVSHK